MTEARWEWDGTTAGDLGRLTLHYRPEEVAEAVLHWFGGDLEALSNAAAWFDVVAVVLGTTAAGRRHPANRGNS